MPKQYEAIVVGGGQAGLATAYYLLRAGVDTLVLDNQDSSGGAWLHVWPSMTLFSTAGFSNLPGIQMPNFDGFPPAEHVVDYLKNYEERFQIPVERPVAVTAVEHSADGFTIFSERHTWQAKNVVMATGTWSRPFVPHYPGTFVGEQWHSASYPGIDPFRGTKVAVVGAANSAAQIAAELTDVAEVTWFTRRLPRWMPDDVDGRALFMRNRGRALSIQRGEGDPGADSQLGDIVMLPAVRHARDTQRLVATPMFHSLNDVGAEHLIWCTGFRPALRAIRKLIDAHRPTVPGLHLVGYGDWLGPGSATITGLGPYAKQVAREVAVTVGKMVK